MKKQIKQLSFIVVMMVIGTLTACHKDNHEEVTATISFMEPTDGDTIALNEELHAEGTILGSAELHGYTLTMKNITTNEELLNVSSIGHASSYAFHEHWVNTVSDTSTIQIVVAVELDHDGNKTSKTINIVALPQ